MSRVRRPHTSRRTDLAVHSMPGRFGAPGGWHFDIRSKKGKAFVEGMARIGWRPTWDRDLRGFSYSRQATPIFLRYAEREGIVLQPEGQMAARNPCRNYFSGRLTNEDLSQWIDNDEGLYLWWKGSRLSKRAFIKAHKAELTEAITAALRRPPRS